MPDALLLAQCPFFWETDRRPEDRYPCPERYVAQCGCQRDSLPAPRPQWKRTRV